MPHILFISRFAGFQGGIENYQYKAACLLKQHGCEIDFAWCEPGRDHVRFLEAFDNNFKLDEALHRPDVYDSVIIHKLYDLEKLHAVHDHFQKTALFVHDHDIYCPRHHYYTPFGRANCHRCFKILRCGLCALASHPRHWEGGLTAYCGSLFCEFSRRLDFFRKLPKVAVLSEFMRNNLILNGFDPSKITVIPPSVTVVEKPLKASQKTIQLLFAGQLIRGKGADILLENLAKAKSNFHLDIAGDGPDKPLLQSII